MKDINIIKKLKRERRKSRVRSKMRGTAKVPRLTVYRSLSHIYAQLIDDLSGKTLISASDLELKKKKAAKGEKKTAGAVGKTNLASQVGALLAKKALEKGLSQVIFDRGAFKYHGRVKALADGAREGGLKF